MNSQKGMALIVSLVVLVVAALLGLSSYQASQLEERMAGNHRLSVSALQATEVGINKMLSSVVVYAYSPGAEFCDDVATSLSGTGFTSDGVGYSYSDSVEGGDLDVAYKAYMTCDGSGHVLGFSRGAVLGADGEEISARRVRVEIVPPGYDSINSILGNGINITGNSTIIGDVHSNSDVTLSLQATGNPDDRVVSEGSITSTGSMDIGGSDAPNEGECSDVVCAASGVPERNIPSAQDVIDQAVADYLAVNESGEIVPSGDGSGKIVVLSYDAADNSCSVDGSVLVNPSPPDEYIYYCPGALTVTGDFGGVTVMSEGDFVHNGAISINDAGEIDTLVVSGGNIELNGGSGTETYAAFHSEGDFIQNGSSKIYGAIVAGGSITANGGIDFEARDTGKILVPVSGHLEGWVELEDPADESNMTS